MYRKCGSLEDAEGAFYGSIGSDVILWTAIITAYAKRGLAKGALELFEAMLKDGITPDAFAFVSILNACQSCPSISIDFIYMQITSLGLNSDIGVMTALLNLHVKRGNKAEAEQLFHKLPEHSKTIWNSLISLYSHLGHSEKALALYYVMLREGIIPDSVTFVATLQAFSSERFLSHIKQLHVNILAAQLASNMILLTTLMNAYGKCKNADGALKTWECMASRNVIVWSSFFAVLTHLGLGQSAVVYFDRMFEEGVLPNEVTFTSVLEACTLQRILARGKQIHACLESHGSLENMPLVTALLNLYSCCSHLEDVNKIFDKVKYRDVVLWTAAISARVSHRCGQIIVQLFNQMAQEGVLPNLVTYINVLDVCWTLPSLVLGKQLHTCIGNGDASSQVDVGTALINMYGKCGCVAYAHDVFDTMLLKDRLSWTAIISSFAHNGKEKEVLQTFRQMLWAGVLPDSITFLSIMSSCCHSGLVDLGIGLFFGMINDFGLQPLANHYDCVINLLGRAGQIQIAEQLLRAMPENPSEVSWTSILGAYRNVIIYPSR
ncbi:hypothetical protein KP509_25G021200 [Ceratopteris richardii]|nr:hypothetical protein KP509_25G021200 [Ceratopteris richardii]